MSLPTISFIGTEILTSSIVNSLLPEEQCNVIIEGYTSIGANAFDNKSQIVSVICSDSVTSINRFAFRSCTSLTSITLSNYITFIGRNGFQSCSSLKSIIIPNSITLLENEAFLSCSSLESIIIPNSVTSIGQTIFANCTSLVSATIPNSVTLLRDNMFKNCSSLTSIIIPESITTIKLHVFNGCSSLTTITIPDTVTVIGIYAFANCSSLIRVVIQDATKIATIYNNSFTDVSANPNSTIIFDNPLSFSELSNTWQTISNYYNIQKYGNQIEPTIDFPAINVVYGTPPQQIIFSSNSSGSVTFESSNALVATVNATVNISIIEFVGVGTSEITLNQFETGDYLAGTSVAMCTVSQNSPENPVPLNGASDLAYYLSGSHAEYANLTTSTVIIGDLIANNTKGLTVDAGVIITKSTEPT